jgi:NADH-ubiquinone oxidoreductase chain 1
VFSNIGLYYFAPLLAMFIILMVWLVVPVEVGIVNISFSLIYVFCCLGVGVYVLIYRGWSSNSNYALVGAIRGVSQTISYEVSLVFLLLCLLIPVRGFNISEMILRQEYLWLLFLIMPVMLGWVVTMLAERNRTPFDFSEGESELVSGFNIEYGRGGFAVLFLAEYGMIIFISYLISFIFIGGERVIAINMRGLFFCFFFL